MLQRSMSLSHRSLRAIELTMLVFDDYTNSAKFEADATEFITYLMWYMLNEREYRPGPILLESMRCVWKRALYRCTECAIVALCINGPVFCRDAVSFYYFYPTIRDYFVEQCWAMRLTTKLTTWLYPRVLSSFFTRSMEPWLSLSPYSSSAIDKNRTSSNVLSNTKINARANDSMIGRSYNTKSNQLSASSRYNSSSATANKSQPKNMEEAFAKAPSSTRDALRFYRYTYDLNLPYAVCAANFIPDVAEFVSDSLLWMLFAMEERHKPSFPSRAIRMYVTYVASMLSRNTVMYLIRFTGAWLGRCFASQSVGKSIFWSENLIFAVTSPLIAIGMMFAVKYSDAMLSRIYPRSAEEIVDDERDEAEAARQFADATAEREVMHPDAAKVDHYEVLGVTETATLEEIKKAYRKLALSNHPDRVGSNEKAQADARDRMASINNAYNTLSNEQNRMQYDALRHNSYFGATLLAKKISTYSTGKLTVMLAGFGCGVWILTGALLNLQVKSILNRITQPGSSLVVSC